MTTGPTSAQVAAQVAMIRRQRPEARVIGIHTPGGWAGGATLQANGESCHVAYCCSALQVREALVSLGEGKDAVVAPLLLVLTPLDEAQLGLDVLARLAGRQLYRIDHWHMARDLFRARAIDPRLPSQAWLAEALLQHIPPGGYPPVASGVLDADTVWKHLLTQYLDLQDGRPDAVTLLAWSLSAAHLQRYEALPGAWRPALRQRVQDTAGAVGVAMLDALDTGHGALLLPLGLVCDILFAPAAQQQLEIAQARVRLEPYLAGRLPPSEVGHAWAAAAASVLAALPEGDRHAVLAHSEQLLLDLKASAYSALSNVLRSGLQQRLTHFATALQGFLRGQVPLDQLEAQFHHLSAHQEATRQSERMERVRMALRLARYLAARPAQETPPTLARAAAVYTAHGGYVDWARRYLVGGDETAELAAAFGLLADRICQEREQQNKHFAVLLAAWHRAPGAIEGLLPVEQTLSHLVARLAQATAVLLLVLDALSYADCCELLQDCRKRGWMALTEQPGPRLRCLLSTVPSVTATARTSLLSGTLTRGDSAVEKRHFAAHGDLRAVSRSAYPPVLFHKGELLDTRAAGLSTAVREAVRNAHRRVVGVVVNAVDDHLAKSDQLRLAWTIEQFYHLDALLYEAQLAQRAVIITSDHGHMLEMGSKRLAGSAEERWRPYSDRLAAEELVFAGPRVQQVTGVERIIAPWSEMVRYSQKKQGYHGGATPQEVLVPLAVLVPQHRTLAGWEALPDYEPGWWSQRELPGADVLSTPARTRHRAGPATAAQGTLFADMPGRSSETPRQDWIARLLSSPVFAAQRRVAGRRAPDDQLVRTLLAALEAHRDRMAHRLLAQVLGAPEFRLRSILTGVQRLLNVDGYQVIAVDDLSDTVTLDRQLLDMQFQLDVV
jgi:hypothetical protein